MNAITIHGWSRWRRVWWSISIWNWNFRIEGIVCVYVLCLCVFVVIHCQCRIHVHQKVQLCHKLQIYLSSCHQYREPAHSHYCFSRCFLALFATVIGSDCGCRWRVIYVLLWQGYRFWSQVREHWYIFNVFWWIWFIGSNTIVCFYFSEEKKRFLFWPFNEQFHFSGRIQLNYALHIDAIFNFLDDKMQKYILNEFQRFIYTSFLLSCIFRMLNSIRLIVVSHYFLMFENPLIVLHFIFFCFVCGSRAMRLYHQVRFTISLHSNAMHLQVNRI